MLKYVSKFTLDILPSVAATVIGAYVVNHYIVAKPAPNAPAAAAVSTADPKAEAKVAPEAAKADSKLPEAKALEKSSDVANTPEAGVKAKGISEKAVLESWAVEKPAEKSPDKPADAASTPIETRKRQPAPREKTARTVPAPVQPSAPAVVAAPNPAPPAASAPEERRDANDLARAAIERLRGANDGSPRAQEAARIPDASRIPDATRIPDAPRVVSAPPAVRPLPPPIMVSTPGTETFDSTVGSSQMKPPYAAAARIDDPRRPTPPADIPGSRPVDLRAEGAQPSVREEHTTVAEDVLSAAKSVFHAVLPK
jgi:hypothetical protein